MPKITVIVISIFFAMNAYSDSAEVAPSKGLKVERIPNPAAKSQNKTECPDTWVTNMMPSPCGNGIKCKGPGQYFVVKGKRRELSEYDLDWVKANCKPKHIFPQ